MTTAESDVRRPTVNVGDVCVYYPVVVDINASIADAARQMREHHIGDVVVTEAVLGRPKPVGMLTDRDLVVQVIAENVDTDKVNVADVMSTELYTVSTATSIDEAIAIMHDKGVRRLPVVDSEDCLVGVTTIDDLLGVLAKQLALLFDTVVQSRAREVEKRQ